VFEFANMQDNSCESILYTLQFLEIAVSHTSEQWVAVIEPRIDYAAGNDSSNIVRKRLAYIVQRVYVEIAGFAHVSRMLVEC